MSRTKKPRDERLEAFRARFPQKETPVVRVRHGEGRPRSPTAAAPPPTRAPAAPARPDLGRWESLPDQPLPDVPFEPRPRGRIKAKSPEATQGKAVTCADCGRLFDPDLPEHRRYGRHDQCGACGRGEDPPRLSGEMEWYHKSVPVLRIHGRPDPTTPEEKAKLRRR